MNSERFLALCSSFCAACGLQPPELEPERDGSLAFHARVGHYTAAVVYAPSISASKALVLVDVGEVSPDAGVDTWKALLRMNLVMSGKHSPTLGLSDADHVVVRMTYPLELSGPRLLERLLAIADWADQWHAGAWSTDKTSPPCTLSLDALA